MVQAMILLVFMVRVSLFAPVVLCNRTEVPFSVQLLFTEIGYGANVFKFLSKFHHLFEVTLGLCGALMFLLYLFDFRWWAPGVMTFFAVVALWSGLVFAAIFAFREKPYAPLAILYVGTPLVYMFCYLYVFQTIRLRHYMISLAIVLVVAGVVSFVVSLV